MPETLAVWTMLENAASVATWTRYWVASAAACQVRIGRVETPPAPFAGVCSTVAAGIAWVMVRSAEAVPMLFGLALSTTLKSIRWVPAAAEVRPVRV